MLKKLVSIIALQVLFVLATSSASNANSDLTLVFQSTEKMMEKEGAPFFASLKKIDLLKYMKHYNDKKGVARFIKKLSAQNSTEKEVGSFTVMESQIAKAELFLGETDKARARSKDALLKAPKMWLSHGNDRPFNAYIELMGIYLEAGGDRSGLTQAEYFLNKVAKGYREDGWRHQLYQNLGRMWVKAGYISNAREDFQKAIQVALTFPTGKGRDNERMNYLLNIASFQGQAGLFDDMAKTISLIDTTDGESIQAAWDTIKATIDIRAKQMPQ